VVELTEFELAYLQRVVVRERFVLLQSIERHEQSFAGDRFGLVATDRQRLAAFTALW
jgi:hypothetical protein